MPIRDLRAEAGKGAKDAKAATHKNKHRYRVQPVGDAHNPWVLKERDDRPWYFHGLDCRHIHRYRCSQSAIPAIALLFPVTSLTGF